MLTLPQQAAAAAAVVVIELTWLPLRVKGAHLTPSPSMLAPNFQPTCRPCPILHNKMADVQCNRQAVKWVGTTTHYLYNESRHLNA